MNKSTNHIIHKQTIDIQFRDFDTAQKWMATDQSKTAHAVRKSIERCLENFNSTHEYLTIDKLELDLGAFGTEELLTRMPEKIYAQLQQILTLTPSASTSQPASPIVKRSALDALFFFLQNGHLPWWYANTPSWQPEWLQELTTHDWHEWRNILRDERQVTRLIAQFNDDFLTGILHTLQPQTAVKQAWTWLLRLREKAPRQTSPTLHTFRRHFWTQWINSAVQQSAVPTLASFLDYLNQPVPTSKTATKDIPEYWQIQLKKLQQNPPSHAQKNQPQTHPQQPDTPQQNQTHQQQPDTPQQNQTNQQQSPTQLQQPDTHQQPANQQPTPTQQPANRQNPSPPTSRNTKSGLTDKENFILIPYAGLVIIHPFLPQLFQHFQWLDNNKFISEEARTRAVYALHYLAAGDQASPEYDLVLPKLLCGIPLDTLIENTTPLTDAEKDACNEMLTAVISHWKILRNSSPDALRGTFLCRQGNLFPTDEGWRLEIQHKTEDILINRLPWGFSMIKFSWMPQRLTVSWE